MAGEKPGGGVPPVSLDQSASGSAEPRANAVERAATPTTRKPPPKSQELSGTVPQDPFKDAGSPHVSKAAKSGTLTLAPENAEVSPPDLPYPAPLGRLLSIDQQAAPATGLVTGRLSYPPGIR